jgi:outer membrane protein OmpA-like peptidoglycan-associated protein
MKKSLVVILLSLFAVIRTQAQTPDWDRIKIGQPVAEVQNERLILTFDVSADKKAVKRKEARVLTPVLTDGRYSLPLSSIVVRGAGFKALQKNNAELSDLARNNRTVWVENGRTALYRVEIPMQSWMWGVDLVLNGTDVLPRERKEMAPRTLASGLQIRYPAAPLTDTEPPVIPWDRIGGEKPFTTADLLAERHPYVVREPMYGEMDPFDIYADERENAAVVHFHVGSHYISPQYKDNELILSELSDVINHLTAAEDCRIERVLLAGFASPEGSLDSNERLAYDRAAAIKEHLLRTTDLPYHRILLYNGSVDWRTLRKSVENSNLREKEAVIDIIDGPRGDYRDTRLARLQQLNGGNTYYRLLRDFFPGLRSGTLIRIYYKNEAPQ